MMLSASNPDGSPGRAQGCSPGGAEQGGAAGSQGHPQGKVRQSERLEDVALSLTCEQRETSSSVYQAGHKVCGRHEEARGGEAGA